MKILLFCFKELGGLGGVEVVVLNLKDRFKELGHSVGIVEIVKEPTPKRFLEDGTPVWGVIVPSNPTIRRPRSWASFARAAAQFMSVAREFDPDIVNVHFPLSQCLPIVGAHALPHRWRLVVTVHNSDIRMVAKNDPSLIPWQARLFARADAVTAVNQALLDDAIAAFPAIATKGKVIVNGVGDLWFQPMVQEDGQNYVLFAGRLSHVKGADLLLKAWANLRPCFPKIKLWLAGDGDERENLESLAKNLGVFDSVVFLGRKNQEELCELYRRARAVVLPSRREGLPLTLLEAGAAGAICVGSRTPGIPEIIQDGVTGYLVDTESVPDLTNGMKKALDLSVTVRQTMKKAAQEEIRARFSESTMIAGYVELFRTVTA